MTHVIRCYMLVSGLAVAGWGGLVATAEAVVGRPATPVSYAGVPGAPPLGWERPA